MPIPGIYATPGTRCSCIFASGSDYLVEAGAARRGLPASVAARINADATIGAAPAKRVQSGHISRRAPGYELKLLMACPRSSCESNTSGLRDAEEILHLARGVRELDRAPDLARWNGRPPFRRDRAVDVTGLPRFRTMFLWPSKMRLVTFSFSRPARPSMSSSESSAPSHCRVTFATFPSFCPLLPFGSAVVVRGL